MVKDESLHLSVSMRSFRAEHVSRFVKAVLDREIAEARDLLGQVRRALSDRALAEISISAKAWIRQRARGSERFGLVASSGAQRLKPHAVDVRVEVDPVHWFLNDRDDTRSSFYLEDAATEFQVQGLELDWVCVTWDADFRFAERRMDLPLVRRQQVAEREEGGSAAIPAQRVSRAAHPRAAGNGDLRSAGGSSDATRPPEYYDATFHYFTSLGIPVL